MILAGDIGGTNARLALAAPGATAPLDERRYATADFRDFAAVLAAYLDATRATVSTACFAVAGPIGDDGRGARLTNLPWTIDAAALEARFGIPRVMLANDFAAAALGVTVAAPESIVQLQAGAPLPGAPRLVIGAGTGLGVAGLLTIDGGTRAIPGEGGHLGFAPQTLEQAALWRHLFEKNGRVTAEDVIAGPGLARIHAFLHGREASPEDIGAAALAGDAAARRTVDLWLACFGAFAGDLAMHWLARGGIYLAGGVTGKLMPYLDVAPFLSAFNDKREHERLVRNFPIRLVRDDQLGLKGALALAGAGRTG